MLSFFFFLFGLPLENSSPLADSLEKESTYLVTVAERYRLNLYFNPSYKKRSINFLEHFDTIETTINELKSQNFSISLGKNQNSKFIFSKMAINNKNFKCIRQQNWNRYPFLKGASLILTIVALISLFARFLPILYRNPLPKITRFQNDTFIFNNNFKILTRKPTIVPIINHSTCWFDETSYAQIRYFLKSNSIHKFFVLPFSKFINLGLTAHCFLFDVNHNTTSQIQQCELCSDENILPDIIGISHTNTHEITIDIPEKPIKIYTDDIINPLSSRYYMHCNTRLVFYDLINQIMLKATGIDTFICAIGQIFTRIDFDAFGFFCDVQAGLEVIEFCTKDQQINKIVFDIVPKMKPTHLKIYRRKNYLIYASMLKLGRNNYYVVGVIDKNYPIIYSIEEPFATLSLLLSLIFHLNISLSEDSKTLQRVHDLFKRIGVFGLFEFYGNTGESCDILSHQSEWTIKMTDDLVNCIKQTPYDTNELYIYKLPNNQWIGIISRVERDYIKSHYVRTILVEDLTRMKKVCDKETDIHSDELLLQEMLNIHVFHKGNNYMDESLAQELGYSRQIDSIFDIIYPEDAGFFSKYIRTPNWIVFRLKSSSGEYMWYCSYQNCLFCIHEDLQQPTAEFAIDLDQTLMAAAGNYINLYSIDVKTDEILTAFAPQRFVPHIGREFVEYYEESFKSKFELNYAKIKSGEQTSLHFLALVIMTDEKTYGWYDTIMERHPNDTIAFAFILCDYEKRFKDQLIDAKSVIDLALFHSNVVHWEFENDDEQELVFTSRPVTYKPVHLNLTSLEHNVSSDCLERVRNVFDKALIDEEPFEVEVSMIFEKMRWILFRGRKNNNNLSGVYFDLTELRENELLLEQQKQKALEASNAKSMFLANMTHEIRTPMGGMLSLLELLMQTEMTEEQQQMMKVVKDSFNRLMEMLNDTLDIAKIDQNRMTPSYITFTIAEYLKPLFTNLSQQVNPNVHFYVDVDAEFPLMFYGDPHFLMRICHNLISNAIKFTEKGSINCEFRVNNDQGGFDLNVSDTGIGIQKSKLTEIFETFIQGDSSVTRHYGGSGIGLSLISKLLKLIGGDVKVESVPNVGSTFMVHFPYEICMVPYISPKLRDEPTYLLDFAGMNSYVIMMKFAKFYGVTVIKDPIVKKAHIKVVAAKNENEANELEKTYPKAKIIIFTENRYFNEKVTHEVFKEPILPAQLRKLLNEAKRASKYYEKAISGEEEEKQIKVLAAEDNKVNQLVLQKVLTKLSLEFKIVTNGQEAIDSLDQEDFDIILMDQHMPVLDGVEATKIIRKSDKNYSKIPIIALTASTLKEDMDECINAGMNTFVVKPVSIEGLQKVISMYAK